MLAPILLRLSSQVMHAVMGGMAIFCLWYAAILFDYDIVLYCFVSALKWGAAATAIMYFQHRYLDQ